MEWHNKFNSNDTVPYIQGLSEGLRSTLKKFINNVYFKNTNTLDNFLLKKKDSDPTENLSSVIYLIEYKCCNKVFIGETGWRLKTRIKKALLIHFLNYIIDDKYC